MSVCLPWKTRLERTTRIQQCPSTSHRSVKSLSCSFSQSCFILISKVYIFRSTQLPNTHSTCPTLSSILNIYSESESQAISKIKEVNYVTWHQIEDPYNLHIILWIYSSLIEKYPDTSNKYVSSTVIWNKDLLGRQSREVVRTSRVLFRIPCEIQRNGVGQTIQRMKPFSTSFDVQVN